MVPVAARWCRIGLPGALALLPTSTTAAATLGTFPDHGDAARDAIIPIDAAPRATCTRDEVIAPDIVTSDNAIADFMLTTSAVAGGAIRADGLTAHVSGAGNPTSTFSRDTICHCGSPAFNFAIDAIRSDPNSALAQRVCGSPGTALVSSRLRPIRVAEPAGVDAAARRGRFRYEWPATVRSHVQEAST